MAKFIINGNKPLNGEITVAGSKNAVLPMMAACLLTADECILTNVPKIRDVETMASLLSDLGAEVSLGDHRLSIRAAKLSKTEVNPDLAAKLRGSILLLGPLLARKKKAAMILPGGDLIGKRPVDAHLRAFEDLGAEVRQGNGIELNCEQLTGNKIVLIESSVTATENALMAAVLASGTTIIKLAAMEPHVQALCEFLNRMGAKISGIGSPTLVVEGALELHGATAELIPDSNEAAGFITLAAATKSDVVISRLNPEFMEDFLLKLRQMHVNFETGKDYIHVSPSQKPYTGSKIQSGLYPKLASDDMPPMAVLATQAEGESYIFEWLYENRLSYVQQLKKMGANAEVLDSHQVKIAGVTPLHGAKIIGLDIRMGMTMIIAALVATGQSEIGGVEHIDRGYERLEERLQSLGADIKRID
ncbi:MAG: UDP-N-acetylglucosamine 1-carboxyvinyltransferase [Candidatus Doudnabacteria bacterium RIFCSPLOWO2_02_FULL_48_8]|uniref:UDP-N-acetylglucosamine 1-carboxyvinyltransferase n=1 Tax=Candidatus Doudnabacteria bacterium RIFCSPHIGHO2_01_FULL_46_24 TaxID=1817825 RepID=A0A1F5NV32_9BACT|nr:MAG: UDP-N-acetylglucosamine 1-carboxyvinyltransferase [Candidatus Doudnabacteria bacterium RIFCSPHIGHO2_01_FULL_46_24]OGE95004.1 MAG: UDP-N-acetylglucosamine 1-carboxyvinyltransferase [Candidatus Doudnabacteria bacterium RIFCSPLOWO2_02_FULL_48_8]OGE95957.1 MAG: UDP-N-acetylglucosamine 1-carboxyvinyltransferase [Candidatus Doudnabacteria bacterium RIFCSPHIGHO2_12_FULL_48_11]